jgi:hypothetical protein
MPDRDIFISYSWKDDAIARLACERLEQAGYSARFRKPHPEDEQ